MDSSGHVHIFEKTEDGRFVDIGFTSRNPIPDECNARKVLAALEKLSTNDRVPTRRDAALLPLTPFEAGYVLGVLAEYRAWKAQS